MTKKEAMRRTMQDDTLRALGFTQQEAEQLRRISMTLRRWHELECGVDGGCVERDEKTGKTYWRSAHTGNLWPYADRETGALKRLAAVVERRNSHGDVVERNNGGCPIVARAPLSTYIQTDPRGAALYIIRPGDVPEGADVSAYYNRGICVY